MTLEDAFTGLQVVLRYVVFEECDLLVRNSRIVNATGAPVRITRALSMSVDLPHMDWDMLNLYGTWAQGAQCGEAPGCVTASRRWKAAAGASSHQHNPFIALAAPSATEESGEVYGAALVYSGNFLALAEATPMEQTRLQLGIHPADFSWILEPEETFTTPEAMLTFSDQGLGGMSRNFHQAIRQHLGHSVWRNRRRPIVINHWEATYFHFDEQKILEIIDSCQGLGIDTFVLDDGWFGHRDDDTTSWATGL